ncbi:hypothetical protein AMK26_07550 [Streptomyces sp. CB03234]|uniref:hypothetical protein n=1 Tax=Streptomyces sp. (strain CB03234) TaxID=1703937 RepID=UPI00093A20F4|nr:hypothetical protein [Streptomyces sp. CB03234]OKK05942.1 hypothetical protein AMK26_07550 [Streptomyces sp. CB03234]
MRKTITTAALVLAATLLTGCGGGSTDDPKPASGAPSAKPSEAAKGDGPVSHQVTLEVQGTGSTLVYYNLDTNKGEQVTLPWKKTATITFTTEAEKKIGTVVSVVPGSVPAADGTLKAAPCVITVDGKKVADNKGANDKDPSSSMCKYALK